MSPTKNTVFWVLLRKGLNTPTNQGKNRKQVKVIMTLVDNQWRYAHGHINTPNPSNFLSLSTHPIFPVVFPILSLFFSSLSLSLSFPFIFCPTHVMLSAFQLLLPRAFTGSASAFCTNMKSPLKKQMKNPQNKWCRWETPLYLFLHLTPCLSLFLSCLYTCRS